MRYEKLLENAISRRIDTSIRGKTVLASARDELGVTLPKPIEYALISMQMVDPVYTEETFKQGARVLNQINSAFPNSFYFEYQGSTTNETNIKSHSDIDLLSITKEFVYLAPCETAKSLWKGNAAKQLQKERAESQELLARKFPAAKVQSGDKSLSLEEGSLTRKVDLVSASWKNTDQYIGSGKDKTYRAVRILDTSGDGNEGYGDLIQNQPFLHNYRVNQQDDISRGGVKRAARLMKSIKYDTKSVEISSYDIVAIAFHIDIDELKKSDTYELGLVATCRDYCHLLLSDKPLRDSLEVPNESRHIFEPLGSTKISGLQSLYNELSQLQLEIEESVQQLDERVILSNAATSKFSASTKPDYSILRSAVY